MVLQQHGTDKFSLLYNVSAYYSTSGSARGRGKPEHKNLEQKTEKMFRSSKINPDKNYSILKKIPI